MSLKRTIRDLIQVMKDEDLAEIEVRRPFWTVRVRRPATADLASGLHTGALVLQTTQIVGVSVTLDAGWPGESYNAQVMDGVYQGATRIEINTNNVHYEIRYLIVIDAT